MSLLPTGKFRHTCRAGDAFIKDTWSEQAQASEDLQKDGIRGGGLMSKKNTSIGIFVDDLKKLKTLRRMRKTIPPKKARGRGHACGIYGQHCLPVLCKSKNAHGMK